MASERPDNNENVLSHQIADTLRQSILNGELRPGERIRQEELAARFKASRFPVREALRILESGGLVTLRANRGAWVNILTQAECLELYKVREQLEALLIRDSVSSIPEESFPRLEELVDLLDDSASMDVDRYVALDHEFHSLTYAGSAMETVRSLVDRLVEMTNYYRRAYRNLVRSSDGRDWILQYDHRLILDAIMRGDAEEASVVMALHTRRARLSLEEHPEIFVPEADDSDRLPRRARPLI